MEAQTHAAIEARDTPRAEDGFIGIEEAAKFLGVSQATIRRMTSSNRLKCYRFSRMGHRRFRKVDLLEAFSVQAG